jgi:hypothetical protein
MFTATASCTYAFSFRICTGIAAEFMIEAVDSFTNRRPGGEDISVILRDLESSDGKHRAGKVTDNSDGTYTVTYSITVSSTYHLSITFNSVLAAGSPHTLTVQAQTADESLTYAYGNFRKVMTGRTHTIFVQTRDRYGNYISTDPDEKPDGSDYIKLEYCNTVGDTCEGKENCVCNDGIESPDVAIQVSPIVKTDCLMTFARPFLTKHVMLGELREGTKRNHHGWNNKRQEVLWSL